jgi:hypothetical protein
MTSGCPYPPALLLSVRHAENLCGVLARLTPSPDHLFARAWLLGRRQEVACFVEHVTRDFRAKRLGEISAASAIDTYLTALHKGLAVHFGERFPSCCASSSSPVALHRVERKRPPEVPTEDLLAGLATRVD